MPLDLLEDDSDMTMQADKELSEPRSFESAPLPELISVDDLLKPMKTMSMQVTSDRAVLTPQPKK